MSGRATLAAAFAIAALAAAPSAAAPAGPSLTASPGLIPYGEGEVVLRGVAPGGRAGEVVSILSQPCRFTEPAEIGSTTTRAGGAYSFRVQPMLNTIFRAASRGGRSRAVRVQVRPAVSIRRLRAGRYRIEVATTNPVFLDGRHVVLQRAVGRRWIAAKRVRLAKASDETAITVVSAATVAAHVTGRVRAFLPGSQAECYVAAASAPIAG